MKPFKPSRLITEDVSVSQDQEKKGLKKYSEDKKHVLSQPDGVDRVKQGYNFVADSGPSLTNNKNIRGPIINNGSPNGEPIIKEVDGDEDRPYVYDFEAFNLPFSYDDDDRTRYPSFDNEKDYGDVNFEQLLKNFSLNVGLYESSTDFQEGNGHQENNFLFTYGDLSLTDDQLKTRCLYEIEMILQDNKKSLKEFLPMPFPKYFVRLKFQNGLIYKELNYDKNNLKNEFQTLFSFLTQEQGIFEKIVEVVSKKNGGVFFVYGHGGIGKTYLWIVLTSFSRSQEIIVLTVTLSEIAALLLSGGRVAHSRFAIPLCMKILYVLSNKIVN
nr:uncharacterized protein LOC112709097 [Arachis hypogaea]